MKSRFTILITVLALGLPQLHAQLNMNLVGYLPNDTFSNGSNIRASDVWGYVAPDSQEYALVGKFNGLSVVSLADPSQPTELFFVPGPSSIWRDIKTYGTVAYVGNETSQGLQGIDLSYLPDSIAWQDSIIPHLRTVHNLWIDNGKLFVCGANLHMGGMGIYNLENDPWQPDSMGQYDLNYVHDVYVRNNMAYAAEINDGYLSIIDMTLPSSPQLLSQTTYANPVTHNTWLNDAGTVCFTTDEVAAAYVQSWDVSDPTNVVFLDRIRSSQSNGKALPHNTHVYQDYLITSYYTDGVQLVDAARPHNLIEVGFFNTGGSTWGAYPYLPSGLVLLSDIRKGLFVLQPQYNRGSYLEGTIYDISTNQALSLVSVKTDNPEIETFSSTNGQYALGTHLNTSVNVQYARYGYEPEYRSMSLTNGNLILEDIYMTPAVALPPISFEFRDSLTGQTIPEIQVQIREPLSNTVFKNINDEGIVVFDSLYAGQYELIAGKWGYISQKWALDLDGSQNPIVLWMDRGYYDDFTFDFGWFVQNGTVAGAWERSIPEVGQQQDSIMSPGADVVEDLEKYAYISQNSLIDGTTTGIRSGAIEINSPFMDLRVYQDPMIYYYRWFAALNFSGGMAQETTDSFSVFVYTPTQAYEVARYTGYSPMWQLDSVRLLDYMVPDSLTKIKFSAANYELEDVVEVGVDFFWVQERNSPPDAIDEDALRWTCFPNPTSSEFQISWIGPEALQYTLHAMNGALCQEGSLQSGSWLSLPEASGLYLLSLWKDGKLVGNEKVMKN